MEIFEAGLHSVNFSQRDFFLATTITLAEGPVYILSIGAVLILRRQDFGHIITYLLTYTSFTYKLCIF